MIVLSSFGNAFHNNGPFTLKEHLANVCLFVKGTTSRFAWCSDLRPLLPMDSSVVDAVGKEELLPLGICRPGLESYIPVSIVLVANVNVLRHQLH